MKKLLCVLLTGLVMAGCGTANSQESKKEPEQASASIKTESVKNDSESKKTVSALAATEKQDTKEVDKMPTERTVNFGPDYPWKRAGYKRLKELIDKGEIVFLWSDAEPLEQQIKRTFSYDPPEDAPTTKDDNLKSMNHYIETFVYGMKKQGLNKPDYLSKIASVGELMAAGKLDEAKTALDKAIQIRTGQ